MSEDLQERMKKISIIRENKSLDRAAKRRGLKFREKTETRRRNEDLFDSINSLAKLDNLHMKPLPTPRSWDYEEFKKEFDAFEKTAGEGFLKRFPLFICEYFAVWGMRVGEKGNISNDN